MRAIVIIALISVVTALFTALVFLYRDRGHGNRVVRVDGLDPARRVVIGYNQ